MTMPEWGWYALIIGAVVGSLILIRRWSYNIAITFESEGRDYTCHRNGDFTDDRGDRIVDPGQIARLVPLAEAAKKERFREMDSRRR